MMFAITYLIKICFFDWKKNLCRHYSIERIASEIIDVAKMFNTKIKF